MNINRMIQTIKNHTDGITVDFNGNIPHLVGFACSLTNNLPVSLTDSDIKKSIQRLHTASKMLGINGYIGSWIDSAGNVFIDLTVVTDDLVTAKSMGKQFKQQAIYDFQTQNVIMV